MSVKSKGGIAGDLAKRYVMRRNWALLLCFGSFCAGMFFTNRLQMLLIAIKHVRSRMWIMPEIRNTSRTSEVGDNQLKIDSKGCSTEVVVKNASSDGLQELSDTQHVIRMINKTVSDLEMKLAAARAARETVHNDYSVSENSKTLESTSKRKYLMVIGINTAFSSRKRRDSVRMTWMPQGEKRKKLEEEKGIVIRFVIGRSSTSGGILNRAIEAEELMQGDFMRLDHVEGYMELSAKTKTYFSTAVAMWDAEFYVKVDDDVHVNLATLWATLSRHRMKSRVYVGCMKSGPVLARKGVRYHEPEYLKFGAAGNKYFRHATGQLYAISKELATYISINQDLLHKYANEDVSTGSWFIGLDVDYVDERRLCCGTPPDCEWKAQAGNICVASFDWRCSGICNSVERMAEVHRRCGEDENAIWSARS
ncbi:probable beta-1,3-galactosyltransferase 2 isoform X2 [Humulus lupulus]|uniref:probable beta-1,3-galactosyltransferase 2 isoform X2 n=1 Tax=Humulus lupulus TaxID=3486 RepID=UPI002B40362B|nr:probable beta-1,3-galactosyltransferase 2 isoform X2 [Humulus lupulus]